MGNEKYLNYYIETLTSTMTDCLIRNVSMQANAKITDEVIQEQSKKIEDILSVLNDKQKEIDSLKTNKTNVENDTINDLNNKIKQKDVDLTNLSNEISELRNKYRDYDSIKNQATHVDTFKTELIKAREETNNLRNEYENKILLLEAENNKKNNELIKKCNEEKEVLNKTYGVEKDILNKQILDLHTKIDYLQLPPAKRKKIDELNKESSPTAIETSVVDKSLVEDGGTF